MGQGNCPWMVGYPMSAQGSSIDKFQTRDDPSHKQRLIGAYIRLSRLRTGKTAFDSCAADLGRERRANSTRRTVGLTGLSVHWKGEGRRDRLKRESSKLCRGRRHAAMLAAGPQREARSWKKLLEYPDPLGAVPINLTSACAGIREPSIEHCSQVVLFKDMS